MRVNILLLCERIDGFGGWYTYTRILRDALMSNGHAVVTCGALFAGETTHPVLPRPLALLSAPWKAVMAARTLRHILEQTQPDIIHITVEPYALLVPFLPKRWRERVVLTIHGSYGTRPVESLRSRFLTKRYYSEIPAFITVSHFTRDTVATFLRSRGWPGIAERFLSRTRVIPNAIALPEWQPCEKQKVNQILLVGGVKPRKGVLEAIEACAAYQRLYETPFRFRIVGGLDQHDTYVRRVQERIIQLGLSDCVTLEGEVTDVALDNLYAAADLYLMPALTSPTTFEGFGIVFIEANARGVPCIGPDTSGAAEAIEEGATGYRVNPQDARQIALRMHWILNEARIDPARCRAWAEQFAPENIVRQIEEAYASLGDRKD